MPAQNWILWALAASLFRSFSAARKRTKKLFASYTFSAEKVEVGGFAPPSEHLLLSGATSLASLG